MSLPKQLYNQSFRLSSLLRSATGRFHRVMDFPPEPEMLVPDFSRSNRALFERTFLDTAEFDGFIQKMLNGRKAIMGMGGYLENRIIYRRSKLFQGEENRCIHLGVDIWAPAFSAVYAPMEGVVHSMKDNANFGDYGPTIILEHRLEERTFYTLYGHLSRRSLQMNYPGKQIGTGEHFCELGSFPENGDWPPHLHFQIILEMDGREGDYPGVVAISEVAKFKLLCPDPNLILNLSILNRPTAFK